MLKYILSSFRTKRIFNEWPNNHKNVQQYMIDRLLGPYSPIEVLGLRPHHSLDQEEKLEALGAKSGKYIFVKEAGG